ADNGGPAWSHALVPNSPAIDASGACSVDFDQRGVSRLFWGSSLRACDIGAYEFETAISGLAAANSGPTVLGSATRLTATVAAGTNVGYTWNFGDGTTIVTTTSVLEYVYASPGSYTVTLTAVNSIGSATPTTTLVIVSPIYVNSQATGSGNGTSWANAYNSLTAALSAARQGAHIWVAAGVYKPGSTSTSSFAIPPGVQVYGGFNGTESSLSQRNWRTNVTILSGDVDNNDTNTDGNSIAETTAALAGTNAVHVVTLNGTGGTPITGTTRLDGFVITAGNGDFGGGLYCDGQNGGVCSPSLANLTFSGNRVSGGGGAIVNRGASGTSSPTLTNIFFQGNTAFASGAMHNEAQSGGTSSPTLVNVVFYNNSASQEAGVMSNLATAGGTSTPLLVNVTAYGNSAGYGEALWKNYSDAATAGPTVVNAVLWGNSGGTLFTASGNTISYSLVQGGTAGTGNLAVDPQFVNAAGGDLRLLNSSPAIDAGSNNAPGLAGIIADLADSARFFDNTAITDTGNGLAPIVDMGAYENQQPPPAYLRQWGSGPSTGDTQFQWPVGIAVTGSHVFVGDYWKLRKFDRNGTLVASQWVNTLGMTVEGNTLYLAEGNNQRVWTVGVDSFSVLAQYAADGLLYDVVRHPNGKFYVVRYGQSVYVYSSNFTYESSLLNGQLSGNVRDIAVDSTGALYLADTGNDRILVFDTNGTILRQWGGLGSAPGALNKPWGLAIDRNDWVYVADTGNHRIQVFTRMGEFLTEWGKKDANGLPAAGTGNGEFNGPASLAFDSIGQLYVSDSNNHRVQVFGYPGMLNGTSAQGRPASSGESGPAEPVLSPAPSESPELPAAQLYLPLIVQPSTEQGAESVAPALPMTPDTPVPLDAIPELTPVAPITSTSALQVP
ncbi:MAG: PKD domain-containing protein, partial [Chloroflexi bacterium]|nr:PKD domain-containing protein [Chloroflexota bacterium]